MALSLASWSLVASDSTSLYGKPADGVITSASGLSFVAAFWVVAYFPLQWLGAEP